MHNRCLLLTTVGAFGQDSTNTTHQYVTVSNIGTCAMLCLQLPGPKIGAHFAARLPSSTKIHQAGGLQSCADLLVGLRLSKNGKMIFRYCRHSWIYFSRMGQMETMLRHHHHHHQHHLHHPRGHPHGSCDAVSSMAKPASSGAHHTVSLHPLS